MRLCPISSVQPYAMMLAPVYVHLKLNGKFISVKGPLDFFLPEELDRLRAYETFYLPEFVESALPFRKAGRQVRALITWRPELDGAEQLPPAPYEVSDAVLRIIGPLWCKGGVVEPYFAAVLANELCDPVPADRLVAARDQDLDGFERAVLRSGWAVFLALHLGYCDLEFLNTLRMRVFDASLAPPPGDGGTPGAGLGGEVDELNEIVWDFLGRDVRQAVACELFDLYTNRAARKLTSRLRRVREEMLAREPQAPSIYGEKGFVDV